ncbi:hypothetical protein RND81_12G121700 [Saponaria officinalis]|uniref:Uncharacterized protein n=1 Tax=Saponaria officinalis TaxID=3572 RepID=A0AAW1H9L9_SAPOF
MLEYTTELIAHAAPSSHFIFCLCNIIILLLLVDRSKHNTNPSLACDYTFPAALNTNVSQNNYAYYAEVNKETRAQSTSEVVAELATANEDEHECEDDNKESENGKKKDDEEEDDGDELKKRIEDFIHKINTEWRAEMLRTSSQCVIRTRPRNKKSVSRKTVVQRTTVL